MEVLTQCFLDTFSLHFLVQMFFFKYIWQNLGFGVYRNLRSMLKSFEMLSYGQSVLSFILNSVSFLQWEFVQLPFQKCLVSCKNKANQIWLAVSYIVFVWGGGGLCTWETPRKNPEISLRYIPVWSSGDAEAVEELIDGRWCWVHVWGGASVERWFFSMGRLQEFVGKPHMFRFFLLFCCFGTFLLAKIRVCFVCMAYIMSILCGLIMFD